MTWDWASFGIGILVGGVAIGTLGFLGLWAFAKGMSDE
jgi:hypothetical protein